MITPPFLIALVLSLVLAVILMDWRYGLCFWVRNKAKPIVTPPVDDEAEAKRLVVILFGSGVLSAVYVDQILDKFIKIEGSRGIDWSALTLTWDEVCERARFKSIEWFQIKVCEAVYLPDPQAQSRKANLLELLEEYRLSLGELGLDPGILRLFEKIETVSLK